jgi:cellulose biosynthesis protein BcsQ
MTRVFVFTNHKGGVGKSTSATNIALDISGILQRAGASNCRVLLIDTDSLGARDARDRRQEGLRRRRQPVYGSDG